jgi:hypothetical protein
MKVLNGLREPLTSYCHQHDTNNDDDIIKHRHYRVGDVIRMKDKDLRGVVDSWTITTTNDNKKLQYITILPDITDMASLTSNKTTNTNANTTNTTNTTTATNTASNIATNTATNTAKTTKSTTNTSIKLDNRYSSDDFIIESNPLLRRICNPKVSSS